MTDTTNPTSPLNLEDALGEFNIPDHAQQVNKQIYYALRDQLGWRSQKHLGESFTWDSFKAKFVEVFGTPEEPLCSPEQLLAFAYQKLGMTKEDLLQANKLSWERRRQYLNNNGKSQHQFNNGKSQYQTHDPYSDNGYQEEEPAYDDIPY